MLRLALHWLAVTTMMLLVEAVLPAVSVQHRTEAWVGVSFVGAVNAGLRPVLAFAGWPITMFTFAAAVVTVNGLVFALAGPVTQMWSVTSLWQGVAAIAMVSGVSWLIGILGTSPYQASI